MLASPPSSKDGRKLYVVYNDSCVATAHLQENIQDNTADLLTTLNTLVSEQLLLTGDLHCPPHMKDCFYEVQTGCSALQKKERIEELCKKGKKVLFIGDGQNDADAMKKSYLSISIDTGSQTAKSISDATIKNQDLTALKNGILFSHKYLSKVKGLYLFTLTYNIIGMTLAAVGILHPVIASLLMLLASCSALFWTRGEIEFSEEYT